MEANREHKLELLDNFDNTGQPASMPKSRRGTVCKPTKTSNSSSPTELAENNDQAGTYSVHKIGSFELKRASLLRKPIRKTKSLSAQFMINIDELNRNVAGSFDHETGSILSRSSGHGIGLFSLAGSSVASEDINYCCEEGTKICQSPYVDEDGPISCWRKLPIEPTLPIYIQFQDVKYRVALKGEKRPVAEKWILHGVTGSVHPGEVLALMGPSGGGKTTLLTLLSGRVKVNSGTITYNDQPYTKSLKKRIGFVIQDDTVFPHLTVKETLTYAALLRLPNTLTREQKKERAMNVISELGLERCQDTIIGGAFLRGISGGERKRVCIGAEIILNPSLLFLDEPTSGLDSTAALRIVQMLHNLAEYFVGAYEARVMSMVEAKLLKPILIEVKPEIQGLANSQEWRVTWCEQFSILFQRGLKERRHEYLSSIRVTQIISTAIIVGLLWWHSDSSTPKRLQDQAGLLFFISVFWAFFPLFTAIFTFPQERAMLVKERSVNMYRLSAYLVARNISDLPLDLILSVVFLLIVYFVVGLKLTFTAFALTLLTVFLSIIAAQGLGLTIGAAFMDVKKATTLASIVVMAFMLSGGFFIQKVPIFLLWLRYVSINYHTYRLLLKIQYSCSVSSSGSCESPFIKGQSLGSGGIELGAMFAMIIGYRVLAYLFLRRMKLRTMT